MGIQRSKGKEVREQIEVSQIIEVINICQNNSLQMIAFVHERQLKKATIIQKSNNQEVREVIEVSQIIGAMNIRERNIVQKNCICS
jgi:hypothetical protein